MISIGFSGCQNQSLTPEILKPKDFLTTPGIINPRTEFGYIGQFTFTVPATTNIFLAGAEEDSVIEYTPEGIQDYAPDNSPVQTLKDVIYGGETLDIYATGEVSHIPNPSVNISPKGWDITIVAGPARDIEAIQGPIGALVGLFDNDDEPFFIGQRKQIKVPRGARSLYLAVLDYPGASSDNRGEFQVSIDVIRR